MPTPRIHFDVPERSIGDANLDAVIAVIKTAWKQLNIPARGLGNTKKKNDINKYTEWYGFESAHWSAIWVSWVFHHAGYPLPRIQDVPFPARSGAACPQLMAEYAMENGQWFTEPKVGDIAFFHLRRNDNKVFPHCGIVYDLADSKYVSHFTKFKLIRTIEGDTNTSNDVNGGHVFRRRRYRSLVGGYYRPDVLKRSKPVEINTKDDVFYRELYLTYPHIFGSDVKSWQRQLDGHGYRLEIDGHFGHATKFATCDYQSEVGLPITGIVDKQTWEKAFYG